MLNFLQLQIHHTLSIYGNPVDIVTPEVTLTSTGNLEINQSGQYYLRVFGHFGRDNIQGTSRCLFYGEIDSGLGFEPLGLSKVFMISNVNDFQSFEFEVFFTLPPNVKLRYSMVRDSSGSNSGGVYPFVPNFSGTPPIPSIGVDISKLVTS